jgi:hypothetical protein
VNIIFDDETYGNSFIFTQKNEGLRLLCQAISEGRKEIARDLNSQVRYRRNL